MLLSLQVLCWCFVICCVSADIQQLTDIQQVTELMNLQLLWNVLVHSACKQDELNRLPPHGRWQAKLGLHKLTGLQSMRRSATRQDRLNRMSAHPDHQQVALLVVWIYGTNDPLN